MNVQMYRKEKFRGASTIQKVIQRIKHLVESLY